MGVPKFYRWISERYPCLSEVVREYQIPEFDNLYLDMNGIIHVCSHPNDEDPHFRITEEKIFKDIFQYIEILFRLIRPAKVFFMAVDGVAPRAKMNQQRGRRFRSAREAEEAEKRAIRKGEKLPDEERFDSNCITPGTAFMHRLHEHLKYFVSMKISTDKAWRGIRIYLSGHETPGEGEHKIMEFIRSEKAKTDYNPNTRHCLYGLDADLIMLGLCTHEPHFSLLREEVQFGGKKNQKRMASAQETTFHLLHLSLMREYLDFEFASLKGKLSFDYDLDKIIDDWVLMEFLVGNDFIPHLPQMHIAHDALPALYMAYIDVLPALDGYINEGGQLNIARFETYLKRVAQYDYKHFDEQYADLKWFRSKTGRKGPMGKNHTEESTSKKKRKLVNSFSVLAHIDDDEFQDDNTSDDNDNQLLDNRVVATEKLIDLDSPLEEDDEYNDKEIFEMEFRQHKRDYYMNKLEYENVTSEVLKDQAECYVRAIQWNLHYYYNGVCSWSWYYPHHYAPFISDVKDFSNMTLEYDKGTPFLPFQQLLAVLPAASKKLLPVPYQSLMCTENSPLIEYYPLDFKTDLNGKLQEWEAVVLIPFIKENRLLEAMKPLEPLLTEEERQRNKHGPCLLYTYSETRLPCYLSPSSEFPNIELNHAACQNILREDFEIDPSKLVKGLCPDVRLDVYFPGFPTLKHLLHTAELKKASVKVFQLHSRNENMLLHLKNKVSSDVSEVANLVLGKSVFVSWPHLVEAKVIAVADSKTKISLVENKQTSREEKLTDDDAQVWRTQCNSIHEHYFGRLGIIIGETKILLYACPLVGRKYIFSSNGRITLEKQWANLPVHYAYQATVSEITAHDPSFKQFKMLEDLFKPQTICFMLSGHLYGSKAEVVTVSRRKVTVNVIDAPEPDIDPIFQKRDELSVKYMPGYTVAHRLGISSHLLSRMTGTFYISQGARGSVSSSNRINVGLNLKFNKRNKEVPGFTRKTVNDGWQYSTQALKVMGDYLERFPELFEFIAGNTQENNCYADEMFGSPETSAERLQEIQTWLKSLPCYNAQQQTCGTDVLEEPVILAIEEAVEKVKNKEPKYELLHVKPSYLYLPCVHDKGSLPDPNVLTYYLYDRVVNVREDTAVPLGLRGIIVGVHHVENSTEIMYDIIFDEEFVGGTTLRCSSNKGYKMPASCLIKLPKPKFTNKFSNNVSKLTPGAASSKSSEVSIKKRSPAGASGRFSRTAANFQLQPEVNANEQRRNLFRINHSPNSPFIPQQTSRFDAGEDNALFSDNNFDSISELNSQPANEFINMWNQLQICKKSTEPKEENVKTKPEGISLQNAAKSLPQSVSLSSPMSNVGFNDYKHNSSHNGAVNKSKATETFNAGNLKSAEQHEADSKLPYDIDGSAKLMEILHIGNDLNSGKLTSVVEPEPKEIRNSQRQKSNVFVGSQVSYQPRPSNTNRIPPVAVHELLDVVHHLYGIVPTFTYHTCPPNNILIQATVRLPDGLTFHGQPCLTKEEACESAASNALNHLIKVLQPTWPMTVRTPGPSCRPIGIPLVRPPVPYAPRPQFANQYPFGSYQSSIQAMPYPAENFNQYNYNFNANTERSSQVLSAMNPNMPQSSAPYPPSALPFVVNRPNIFVPTQALSIRHHKKDMLHNQGTNAQTTNSFDQQHFLALGPMQSVGHQNASVERNSYGKKKRRSRVAAKFDNGL